MSRANAKQIGYARALIAKVGEGKAREIGRRTLHDGLGHPIDVFRPVVRAGAPWRKETVLDTLTRDECSRLIDALLDEAGRSGRRKNNRSRRAGSW